MQNVQIHKAPERLLLCARLSVLSWRVIERLLICFSRLPCALEKSLRCLWMMCAFLLAGVIIRSGQSDTSRAVPLNAEARWRHPGSKSRAEHARRLLIWRFFWVRFVLTNLIRCADALALVAEIAGRPYSANVCRLRKTERARRNDYM